MKYCLIFLVCIFRSVICTDNQTFEKAVALYEQKQYGSAYDAFIAVNPKNSAVWYNLGNCAYKRNQPEQARVFWGYALDQATTADQKESIEHNLCVVEKELCAKHTSLWMQLSFLFKNIPLIMVQLIFLVWWFCLLVFIKLYKHGNKYRSLYFIFLLVLTIGTGIGLGFKYYSMMQRKGVIMKPNVTLFVGPDEQFHRIGTLDQLSEVTILQERSSWFKIKTNGCSGWIKQESIAVL